ncbi:MULTISPECIES: enoyl-CoA hydratase/isomerase family protein [Nitrospirillum]|uniref:Methylglutaconyl-CoA hydratase n=1 Tax=Nitrospirillum amazonense TaxID=28077 RepID=A0A560FKV3_9PROT|nr:enoyl-CoA hydratase/isomerase family protein [Nitrospirillum amazonense]MEC4590845.1 enoyl-CoA hydratase/isomerase family protein [Nitrospirillum amazonense]TWB22228.1 methylglutaconyl-CoA hydratase [Nitrospirillum amazonense]
MTDVLATVDQAGTATVTLHRPALHNAFNEGVIAELTQLFDQLGRDPDVRVILLKGNGPSFSAGADLDWMRRMAGYTRDQNHADALGLATMLRTLNRCPKPTIAVVHGAAFGGGVGLVACCDIAVAAESATFCLSEVKLGLIPATIGPYVVAAMGERACRRYFLTAERFSAAEAQAAGLVHQVVPAEQLNEAVATLVKRLGEGGPVAQAAAKQLVFDCANQPVTDALISDTAERIARIRASDEGREGVSAFLEKRKAAWVQPAGDK